MSSGAMKTLALTAILSALLATSYAAIVATSLDENESERQVASATCGQQCRFKFCDDVSGYRFARADRSFSSAICKIDGTPIGVVGGSREALVGGTTPISQYRPANLRQNYSPSFFKTFTNQGCGGSSGTRETSGVGHESPQQNQMKFLNKKCFVLPLRSYQVVNEAGHVVDNVHTNDPLDCIAFRMEVPKIYLELTWNTGDDLDLFVTEPDGTVIFYGNDVSTSGSGGMLLYDDLGSCSAPCYNGLERTVYDCGSEPQKGKYKVTVSHYSNCGDGPTDWELRVFKRGNELRRKMRQGTDNQPGVDQIGMVMFNF